MESTHYSLTHPSINTRLILTTKLIIIKIRKIAQRNDHFAGHRIKLNIIGDHFTVAQNANFGFFGDGFS